MLGKSPRKETSSEEGVLGEGAKPEQRKGKENEYVGGTNDAGTWRDGIQSGGQAYGWLDLSDNVEALDQG